jgi:hypothetical protein
LKAKIKAYAPSLYSLAKGCYWKYRNLNERFRGTGVQERYWSKRHLREGDDWGSRASTGDQNEWVQGYWDSRSHGHRQLMLEKVKAFGSVRSLLEIGCNCGPNLALIGKEYPKAELVGIDINPEAIEVGSRILGRDGLSNVRLLVRRADELREFQDKAFDLVLTDAVLIYIGPDKIEKVIAEMARLARRALIMIEFHADSAEGSNGLGIYHFGCWKRDYVEILRQCADDIREVRLTKIPEKAWNAANWKDLGYIIEALF